MSPEQAPYFSEDENGDGLLVCWQCAAPAERTEANRADSEAPYGCCDRCQRVWWEYA